MRPGEVVELEPGQAMPVFGLSVADALEYLRALNVVAVIEGHAGLRERYIERLLDHVDRVHAGVERVAALTAAEGLEVVLWQGELKKEVQEVIALVTRKTLNQ